MNWNEEVSKRIEAYLDAVGRGLANKPAGVRADVVDGLRDQINESLTRMAEAGEPVNPETVERLLAEMDDPETFAEGEPVPAESPVARNRSGRWFWLGLAFLLLNAYGIWKWTAQPAAPGPVAVAVEEEVPSPPPVVEHVLRLRKVEQLDVSSGREVLLLLTFSAPPDRQQLTRYLHLETDGAESVDYHLMGARSEDSVVIETEPVLAEKLVYVLNSGLPSADADVLPADQPKTGSLVMEMNMQLRSLEANSPSFEPACLQIRFSAFPDANEAGEFVSVEPPVNYTVDVRKNWRGSEMILRGDFTPGEIYAVTLREGLPAANGSSLSKTVTRSIHFPLPHPAVRLDAPGRYLSPRGTLSLPIKSLGLKKVVATVRPVFANNLVQLALRESSTGYSYYGRDTDWLVGEPRSVTNLLPVGSSSEELRSHLDLRPLTGERSYGVYELELSGKKASGDRRLLVITDLGISARTVEGGAQVWVNSLRTAEPASGTEVTIYAANNQVLARGTTDDQGLARLEWKPGHLESPFLITAERDGDLSFLNLKRDPVNQGEGLGGVPYLTDGKLEAAVFTDRGIYRPGETVFIQALVRNARMEAPESFPLLMRVKRPDGRVFADVPVELDCLGSADAEVNLPEYLPTGRYPVELVMPGTFTVLGQTHIALEDFVPPQIRVKVETPHEALRAGDTVRVEVSSEHLFGSPASGLKVKGAVSFNAAPFAPTNWPGWSFGDPEKSFSMVYRNLGSLTLDAEGKAVFQAQSRSAWRPPARLEMIAEATVLEVSGRAVTGYGHAMVDAYPFYVGLNPAWGEGAIRAGETQRVAVAEVAPDGAPFAEGKPLVMTLSRMIWNSVLRRNRQGRYEWKSERQLVEIRKDTLAAGGQARDWSFSVDGAGSYLLMAEDPASGASSSLSFYAGSGESRWVTWSREKPGRLELTWDREEYRPGETARLQVRAPFSGPGLLTLETDRVQMTRVVRLEKNTAEFEVQVPDLSVPNAYCTLTMIRPAVAEAVWSVHRAFGAVNLSIQHPGHHLKVSVDVPAVIRPCSPLNALVTLKDEQGRPASGEVTLMAVDEAICMLTGFETPDPSAVFEARRALGVSAFDFYSDLMPVTEDQVEGVPQPGGGMMAALRRRLNPIQSRRFKPVALWKCGVETGTNGTAEVSLDLPEFSGELRVMAVAYNRDQTGSAQAAVKVKRDLIVQPALPRFLAIGDRCDAVLMMVNGGESPLTARVHVVCSGPLRTDQGEPSPVVFPGETVTVTVPLEAGPGPGIAHCRIDVEAGSESYGDTIELAVRPASATRVQALAGTVAAGESLAISPPSDWLPESLYLSGAVSSGPSAQLGRALDYVLFYPYGCLEQTISGAFPLLNAGEWIDDLLPSAKAIGDPEARVESAISRVLAMQQGSGGFSFWPSSSRTETDVSLYAVQFLLEAKAAGYDVPRGPLDSALDWVRGRLDRTLPVGGDEKAWILEMQEKAELCHLLALAGRPDAGWNARLFEQSARLNYAARSRLAAAMLISGEPRHAVALMESMALPVSRPRTPGRLLNSPVRDAALLLSAWLDVEPENDAVARLAGYLADSQQDGHWGNTQDDAIALLAFGKLARMLPTEAPEFQGRLSLPSGETISFSNESPAEWDLHPASAGTVTMMNEGPDAMTFWSRIEGVSREPEPATEQGVSIRREFLDRDGNPLDPSELSRGEMIVVRLTVDPLGRTLDQLVIEDLLPAGWEIENPNLATSRQLPWLKNKQEADRHREARDDRMLIFTDAIRGKTAFHYAVRAVTPGTYTLPPVTVSGMYEPEIRGVAAGGKVSVVP